jgi:hypothetical protein
MAAFTNPYSVHGCTAFGAHMTRVTQSYSQLRRRPAKPTEACLATTWPIVWSFPIILSCQLLMRGTAINRGPLKTETNGSPPPHTHTHTPTCSKTQRPSLCTAQNDRQCLTCQAVRLSRGLYSTCTVWYLLSYRWERRRGRPGAQASMAATERHSGARRSRAKPQIAAQTRAVRFASRCVHSSKYRAHRIL